MTPTSTSSDALAPLIERAHGVRRDEPTWL